MNFSTTALAFLALLQSKSGLVKAVDCEQGFDKVGLKFKAGCYGDELLFELLQNGDEVGGESGFSDDQTYEYEWCTDPWDGCMEFYFRDDNGDGMDCYWGDDGYFKLSLNGEEVYENSGDWGESDHYEFKCESGGPDGPGGGSGSGSGSGSGDSGDYDYDYNPFIDMCDDSGDVGTYVYLELGSFPEEISWELTDTDTGDVVASEDYGDLMLDYDYFYYYNEEEGNAFFWSGNLFASLNFSWYNGTNTTDDFTWSGWDDDYSFDWGDYDYDYGLQYPAAVAYHEICYPPACLELTVMDNVNGDGLDYLLGGYGYYLIVNEGSFVGYEDGDFGDGSTVAQFCTNTAAPTEAPVESAESSDLIGDPIGAIFELLEELFRILLALAND